MGHQFIRLIRAGTDVLSRHFGSICDSLTIIAKDTVRGANTCNERPLIGIARICFASISARLAISLIGVVASTRSARGDKKTRRRKKKKRIVDAQVPVQRGWHGVREFCEDNRSIVKRFEWPPRARCGVNLRFSAGIDCTSPLVNDRTNRWTPKLARIRVNNIQAS